MRISAVVGLKDEVELIGPVIAHLRAIGVDHIIVCDVGSTDGSAEIAAEAAQAPDVELMALDDQKPGADRRFTRGALEVARAAGSDRLLFLDADEFPLPATGNLKDTAALSRSEVLIVSRFNAVLLPGGPAIPLPPEPARYGDILLNAPAPAARGTIRDRVRADPDAAWIEMVPEDKVMVTTAGETYVGDGGHIAKAMDGTDLASERAADLFIAHVPFTTPERFARKVANIEATVALHGHRWGENSAWHWRRWLKNVEGRGGVVGEIARNTVPQDALPGLRDDQIVRSAAELFAKGWF